jgi:hypothetical protein
VSAPMLVSPGNPILAGNAPNSGAVVENIGSGMRGAETSVFAMRVSEINDESNAGIGANLPIEPDTDKKPSEL